MELKKWGANVMWLRVMEIVSHHHRKGFGYSTASFTLLQNEHFSGSKAKQQRDPNPAIQYRTSPLTSMASSFVIEREEKFAFAKCWQKPTTRRIFTFQTVGLLLIFQRSQPQCLTQSVCHSCFTDMCKRLFNDSGQCQRGHLGQTVHTPKWEEQMITSDVKIQIRTTKNI